MQVNVDRKLAFKIAGKGFTIKNREDVSEIRLSFLKEYKNILKEHGAAYGLMEYNALEQNYNYFIGFEIADKDTINQNDFIVYEVEESDYLEVPVESLDGLKEGYIYTYKEYFPNKKYFHGLGPDIEFYQYDQDNDSIASAKLFICLRENPHA